MSARASRPSRLLQLGKITLLVLVAIAVSPALVVWLMLGAVEGRR